MSMICTSSLIMQIIVFLLEEKNLVRPLNAYHSVTSFPFLRLKGWSISTVKLPSTFPCKHAGFPCRKYRWRKRHSRPSCTSTARSVRTVVYYHLWCSPGPTAADNQTWVVFRSVQSTLAMYNQKHFDHKVCDAFSAVSFASEVPDTGRIQILREGRTFPSYPDGRKPPWPCCNQWHLPLHEGLGPRVHHLKC